MSGYAPLFEFTRAGLSESTHFGALAVVDVHGKLLASAGDPQLISFMRSSAKPFQALPFLEAGGQAAFQLSSQDIALICASHSGTDEHLAATAALQAKSGTQESQLRCGSHPPLHQPTAVALKAQGLEPTPNRHNCSGKHSGMLAFAKLRGEAQENYLDPEHPIQQAILQALSEMGQVEPSQVVLGIDGCSAPNFAIPLYNAAWAYARLCDPRSLPPARAEACQVITAAMLERPDMVGGPGRFDTCLMQEADSQVLSKGGAEGYLGLGLFPGILDQGSPGVGVAIKISDGDPSSRARSGVALEVLHQLGILNQAQLKGLAEFGPRRPIYNWRRIEVGEARPVFELHQS